MSVSNKINSRTAANEDNAEQHKEQLAIFFMAHYPGFVSFARNYLNDSILSEDIVQEAFVSLIEQNRNNWNENTLKGFLYTTIRNRALNHLRHEGVRNKYIITAKQAHEDSQKQSDAFFFDSIIREEASQIVINAVETLPDMAQQVMGLMIDGMSNGEIAQNLGVSVNTVRTHKFRAYKILRALLSHIRLF